MGLPEVAAIRWVTLGGIGAMALILFAELSGSHTRHVEMAIYAMTMGQDKNRFWFGVLVGMLTPAAILTIVLATNMSNPVLAALAGVAAIVGMWSYEDSYIRAGQSVPLS